MKYGYILNRYNIVKKILYGTLGFVVVGSGIYVATTAFNGEMIAKNIKAFNEVNENQLVKMTKYEKGIFSSNIEYQYKQGLDAVTFNGVIEHGPLPLSSLKKFDFKPRLSLINGEIKGEGDNQNITLNGTLTAEKLFNKQLKAEMILDDFKIDQMPLFLNKVKLNYVDDENGSRFESDLIQGEGYQIKNLSLATDFSKKNIITINGKIKEIKLDVDEIKLIDLDFLNEVETVNNNENDLKNNFVSNFKLVDKNNNEIFSMKNESVWKFLVNTNFRNVYENFEAKNTFNIFSEKETKTSQVKFDFNLKNLTSKDLSNIKNLDLHLLINKPQIKDVITKLVSDEKDRQFALQSFEDFSEQLDENHIVKLLDQRKNNKSITIEALKSDVLETEEFNMLMDYLKIPEKERDLTAQLFAMNISLINTKQTNLEESVEEMLEMVYFNNIKDVEETELLYIKTEIKAIFNKVLETFAQKINELEKNQNKSDLLKFKLSIKNGHIFVNEREIPKEILEMHGISF